MKPAQSLIALAILAVLGVALMTDWLETAAAAIVSIPWFVYFIVAGIVFSGYKFAVMAWEDHKTDQEWIEKEGNVFIRRMEEEKERRRHVSGGEGGE